MFVGLIETVIVHITTRIICTDGDVPIFAIRRISKTLRDDVNMIAPDSLTDYILEVDLKYLHDWHWPTFLPNAR